MAEWTGVPLREVLERAGIRSDAVDVQLIGLDAESPEGGFRRPLPVDKAMDPDTLLVFRMNGSELPADHGFPVRALVPGWVGSSSIKWLGAIEATTAKVWSRNNTSSYVLIGDGFPPEGEAEGQVVTWQSIKSVLILPWPATLAAGTRRLRGYAYSPHAPISTVEWSDDEGASWQQANVLEPRLRYAWARFELEWTPPGAGGYTIRTRATDEDGNAQPDTLPFNEKGYLFNLPLPHPVTVA
jgi:DMSO/TMAO reductase YedYZ molybdopterin-dependent catalytic subunit